MASSQTFSRPLFHTALKPCYRYLHPNINFPKIQPHLQTIRNKSSSRSLRKENASLEDLQEIRKYLSLFYNDKQRFAHPNFPHKKMKHHFLLPPLRRFLWHTERMLKRSRNLQRKGYDNIEFKMKYLLPWFQIGYKKYHLSHNKTISKIKKSLIKPLSEILDKIEYGHNSPFLLLLFAFCKERKKEKKERKQRAKKQK